MSYVGNTPFTAAFLTDTFSGNGSTVAFTMSVAPATTSSVIVAITGVLQDPSTYSVSGTTLTFSAAPPTGTSNISVRYLGIPASGVTTTAYRTQTEFTATAGQTTFSVPSYTVGFIDVYRNGLLLGSPDFTATNGTTVVLTNAASAGDFVETVSFYVSSVLNALPNTGGTVTGSVAITGNLNFTGTGNRITGDFSNATVANRALVQSSTVNGATSLAFIPNGTSTFASVALYASSSDPANTSFADLSISGSGNFARIRSYATGTGTTQPLVFDIGNSERMRIDTSGNLLVGTNSYSFSSTNYGTGISPTGETFWVRNTPANLIAFNRNSDGDIFKFFRSGTQVGAVSVNATNTTYNTASDYRLKHDIAPMTGALAKVAALKPVTYKWNADDSDGEGFIAHELQEVVPQCVTGEKDAVEIYTDEAGVEQTRIKPQGIDTSFLVATLTAAIQEQQAIITQLQADVAALKGNQ